MAFYLTCLKCHYSEALGLLLSKMRVFECKHYNVLRVNLIAKMATDGGQSGSDIQSRSARQRNDSC